MYVEGQRLSGLFYSKEPLDLFALDKLIGLNWLHKCFWETLKRASESIKRWMFPDHQQELPEDGCDEADDIAPVPESGWIILWFVIFQNTCVLSKPTVGRHKKVTGFP